MTYASVAAWIGIWITAETISCKTRQTGTVHRLFSKIWRAGGIFMTDDNAAITWVDRITAEAISRKTCLTGAVHRLFSEIWRARGISVTNVSVAAWISIRITAETISCETSQTGAVHCLFVKIWCARGIFVTDSTTTRIDRSTVETISYKVNQAGTESFIGCYWTGSIWITVMVTQRAEI